MKFGSTDQLSLAYTAFYLAGLNGAALLMVENIHQPCFKVAGLYSRLCCKNPVKCFHPEVSDLHNFKTG